MPAELAAPAIDLEAAHEGTTHLAWAENIARTIAGTLGLSGQEQAELVAVAHLNLCRKARDFRPELTPDGGSQDGQFRGWVHPTIRWECVRAARRLRSGGTYHSPSADNKHVKCQPLPTYTNEGGFEEVPIEDARGQGEEEEPKALPPVALVEADEHERRPRKPPAWNGAGRRFARRG